MAAPGDSTAGLTRRVVALTGPQIELTLSPQLLYDHPIAMDLYQLEHAGRELLLAGARPGQDGTVEYLLAVGKPTGGPLRELLAEPVISVTANARGEIGYLAGERESLIGGRLREVFLTGASPQTRRAPGQVLLRIDW